jgi:hypothetical protein
MNTSKTGVGTYIPEAVRCSKIWEQPHRLVKRLWIRRQIIWPQQWEMQCFARRLKMNYPRTSNTPFKRPQSAFDSTVSAEFAHILVFKMSLRKKKWVKCTKNENRNVTWGLRFWVWMKSAKHMFNHDGASKIALDNLLGNFTGSRMKKTGVLFQTLYKERVEQKISIIIQRVPHTQSL